MGQKRYSDDFKKDAIRLAQESDRAVAATAAVLGIGATTLYHWLDEGQDMKRKKTETSSEELSPEEALKRLERENQQLKRENEQLKMDREILKKAAAFFAKESE